MNRVLALGLMLLLSGNLRADALPADALPEGALRRLGTTRFRLGTGEGDPVLAGSPDGKVLAVSKGQEKPIQLLDAQTGVEVRRLLPPWRWPVQRWFLAGQCHPGRPLRQPRREPGANLAALLESESARTGAASIDLLAAPLP